MDYSRINTIFATKLVLTRYEYYYCQMRIVYIIDSLAQKGGAERIISEKMNYLATIYNYDVSVITCYQYLDSMPNTYPLSSKVKQINLSIRSFLQYKYPNLIRLWVRWKYYRQLRTELQEKINSINPDIVIGLGYTLADVVCLINCRAAKIIESHEARIYTKKYYIFCDYSYLTNLYYRFLRKRYLHIIEKKADVIVTLTEDDAKNWQKAKRIETIPNFSIMPVTKLSNVDSKRVIAVGRLAWQKGYDRLIDIWKIVSKDHPDWQLDIFGEGNLEMELKNRIKDTKLNNISMHPFTDHISQEYAASSICVLTSRFEGFSLVLLEALRHGVPCITFDCPYGPRCIVDHEKCGFVIENDNINQFADRLSYLMDHPELRKQFASVAINKAQSYQVDVIMNQWKQLFESIISHKQSSSYGT